MAASSVSKARASSADEQTDDKNKSPPLLSVADGATVAAVVVVGVLVAVEVDRHSRRAKPAAARSERPPG